MLRAAPRVLTPPPQWSRLPWSNQQARGWQRSVHIQQCSPMLVHIDVGGFDCICAGILGRIHKLKTVGDQGRQVRFSALALLLSMGFGSSNSCSDTTEPRVYESKVLGSPLRSPKGRVALEHGARALSATSHTTMPCPRTTLILVPHRCQGSGTC